MRSPDFEQTDDSLPAAEPISGNFVSSSGSRSRSVRSFQSELMFSLLYGSRSHREILTGEDTAARGALVDPSLQMAD